MGSNTEVNRDQKTQRDQENINVNNNNNVQNNQRQSSPVGSGNSSSDARTINGSGLNGINRNESLSLGSNNAPSIINNAIITALNDGINNQINSAINAAIKSHSSGSSPSNSNQNTLSTYADYNSGNIIKTTSNTNDNCINDENLCNQNSIFISGEVFAHGREQTLEMNMQSIPNEHLKSEQKFLEGKSKFEQKDFSGAIMAFTSSIDLDNQLTGTTGQASTTYLTYGYRSRAFFEKRLYQQALQDAIMARKLNHKWIEAYFLQGMSLFHLNRHADCLAALAFGLAQNAKDEHMLQSLVQTALKSDFGANFRTVYNLLLQMDYQTRPFIVTSVIGQTLLESQEFGPAVIVLESALKIGTVARKLRGSVYAALSCAYWSLKNYDKTIIYINKDLEIERELKDIQGQCRAYGNLGFAFYQKRKFRESLDAHRQQSELAIKLGDSHAIVSAFNALGHVHVALNKLSNALVCHSRCLRILIQQLQTNNDMTDNQSNGLHDNVRQQQKMLMHEYSCLGHIYTLKGEYEKARDYHEKHHSLINQTVNGDGLTGDGVNACDYLNLILFKSNMGFLAIKRKNYEDAIDCYKQVIALSSQNTQKRVRNSTSSTASDQYQNINSSIGQTFYNKNGTLLLHNNKINNNTVKNYEMRACGALGHIYRLKKDFPRAREWFEKQYTLASSPHCSSDLIGRSQALCNLAMIHQQERSFDKAYELFSKNLAFVSSDPYLTAYALSHMGGIHLSRKQYKESIQYYRQAIESFKQFECTVEIEQLNHNLSVALLADEERSQSSKTPSTHHSD